MTIRFVAAAEAELDSAIEYYSRLSAGLGVSFLGEVSSTLDRITERPDAWQELAPGIRRCLLHRFPYGVIYVCQADEIVVLGVSHLRRKPKNWQTRLRKRDN